MEATHQPRQERQIRVFISSTFRDMQEERDYLVKFVFPELRKMCEARGVTWGEVDLRWGVTTEQAAEGKVLPICLEEIRRCRPYFIGLLGERYGWIPDTIPQEVIDREPWSREQLHGRKSVTELEIIHGVLREEAMHGHAFFYFRDPHYAESMPTDKIHDFVAENAESIEKLQRLKHQIRRARDELICQLREDYRDPKQLGDWIREDLTRLIDELFPSGSEPAPLDREAMEHEGYAKSRERVYIGRPEYITQLDAHADGLGDQPMVILGESGSGKSALLANWVAHYRQTHPDVLVLQHYIGATPYSANWAAMLRRIMGEFKRLLRIQQDIPDKPDELRSAFPNWLHLAAATGRIVLVLDALNQLEDRDGAPDLVWLPPVMPTNVRLIVSTLPGRSMEEVKKRHWPEMVVKPLDLTERKQLIAEYLAQSAKHLSPAQLDQIANAPQAATPLYLRVLLDELRVFGVYERLPERISHYLQAKSPHDLYRKVIARWEEDYSAGTTLVRDTLTLLWAARRGLTESEVLLALGKEDRPLLRAAWSPLFLAIAEALANRGGLLTFGHDFLRTAARDAYIPTDALQQQAHLRLAEFFQRQLTSLRSIDELPWQLVEAAAWPRLFSMISDVTFLGALWQASEFDTKVYWTRLEDNAFRMVDAYRPVLDLPGTFDQGLVFLLSLLLANAGHLAEALSLRKYLVEHFRQTGDRTGLKCSLGALAMLLLASGDLDPAMALLKEEEEICRGQHDEDGLSSTLGNQAMILQLRGDLDGAMVLHKQKEKICRHLNNKDGLSNTLGNQAVILKERGDLDGAMALLKQVEQVCRELGNKDRLSISLGNQAVIQMHRGDFDGAIAMHKEAEQICRALGNLDGLSRHIGNQAVILIRRGDLDAAMPLLTQQEQLCRELGKKDELSNNLGNQAVVRQARFDIDGAMALYKQQEQICRDLGTTHGVAWSMTNQAWIMANKPSQRQKSLSLVLEAHQMALEHGYAELAQEILPIVERIRSMNGAQ